MAVPPSIAVAILSWGPVKISAAETPPEKKPVGEPQTEQALGEAISESNARIKSSNGPQERFLNQLRLAKTYQAANQPQNALQAYREALETAELGTWEDGEIVDTSAQLPGDERLNSLSGFLELYVESATEEELYQFLERLANGLLGPTAQRRNFVERRLRADPQGWDDESVRIRDFQGMAERLLARSDKPLLPMARVIDSSQLWKPLQLTINVDHWSNPIFFDHVLKFLRQVPFCAELSEFRPLAAGGTRDYSTVLGAVLATFVNHRDYRDKYRQKIYEDFPKNFGTKVMLASLDDSAYLSFLGVLTEYRNELRALEPPHALSIALFALDLRTLDRQSTRSQTATHAMQKWVEEILREKDRSYLDQILEARTLTDAGLHEVPQWKELADRLRLVGRYDPDIAVHALSHLVRVARDDARLGRQDATRPVHDALSGLLRGLLDPSDSATNFALMMHAVTDSDLAEIVCFQTEFTHGIPDYVRHQAFDEEKLEQIDDGVLIRCKAIAVGNCSVDWITLVLPEAIGDPVHCQKLISNLSSMESSLDRWDRCMLNAARARDCATATWWRVFGNNREQHPLPVECERHYVSVLKDDKLPYALRAAIASHLTESLQDLTPNSIVALGVEHLTEGLRHENDRYLRIANPILNVFLRRLDRNQWTGLADSYIDAEEQCRKRQPIRDARYPIVQQQIYNSLRLRVLRDDKLRVQAYVGDPGFPEMDAVDVFALLLEHGYDTAAADLVTRQRQPIQLESPLKNGAEYSEQLGKKIPAFLARIESPELRQRMALALENFKDSSRRKQQSKGTIAPGNGGSSNATP